MNTETRTTRYERRWPSRIAFTENRDRPWSVAVWRWAQDVVLLCGVVLVAILVLRPGLGLDLMWNGVIPLAPALIAIAPGLWRNICPMATFSMLPARLGFAGQQRIGRKSAALLAVLGLLALATIVPLRHLLLNTNGPATALMLLSSSLVAFCLGMIYAGRSGWCNGLCPIHPAEKLYGLAPALTFENARCTSCRQCATPCADSTRSMSPVIVGPMLAEHAAGHAMVGGFAGFIWGWYRVPDFQGTVNVLDVLATYAWPFGCALLSLAAYGIAHRWICRTNAARRYLVRLFATAAICTYYWYRIPALTGFGPHPDPAMLVDLTAFPYLPWISRFITSIFFVWFLLLRKNPGISWLKRPFRVPAM